MFDVGWTFAGFEEFYGLHRHEVLVKYSPRLKIGVLAGAKTLVQQEPGHISRVPYAESSYFMGYKSPYYTESHNRFRTALRKFYDEEIIPGAAQYEEQGKAPPKDLWLKLGQFGVLAARIGPGPHLKGLTLPGGVKPEEFDYFHEMIAHEENARIGIPSFADGLGAGMVIGLPPVLAYGPKPMQQKVIPDVLSGRKQICLAISEPTAGSDVANIECTATKTPDGKFYIVNGVKKWITNGTFCDYFTT
ncbi:hypothetical protein HK102_004130, partial [Quaeritorhiza haematococci]